MTKLSGYKIITGHWPPWLARATSSEGGKEDMGYISNS